MPALSRLHRATAIVPLAVLSAAWTVSLTGSGATTSITAVADDPATLLPDGSTVPTRAIEAPASLSSPTTVSRAPAGDTEQIIDTASTSGIPAIALAAYQRAEAVINAADKSCQITWQLIAAIGRVESDHGRFGGNTLSDEGLAQPGIYGIALNGRNDTQRITDTDAGQYDSDTTYDRAVGPMQFIPSTWSVVGVDGDNDGKRNPQDIDDAALASAVYLCSGEDDLSTDQGQRASIYRYNHSDEYVDLVISIMQAYMAGDFTSVPGGTTPAGVFLPGTSKDATAPARTGQTVKVTGGDKGIVRGSSDEGTGGTNGTGGKGGKGSKADQASASGGGPASSPPKTQLAGATTASPPNEAPTKDQAPTTPSPTAANTSSQNEAAPTQQPPTEVPGNQAPVPPRSPDPVPSADVTPLDQTLTVADAQAQCVASGVTTVEVTAMSACIDGLMTP